MKLYSLINSKVHILFLIQPRAKQFFRSMQA